MTPKLRFSEFKGEWKRFLLKDIVEIKAGGDLPPFWSKEKNDECTFPIFSNSLENYGLYGYSKLPKITAKESVTVTGRGSVGIPVFRKGAYTPIVRLLTLIPKNSYETDCKFLELAIQSIHIFIESTGVPQLTSPQIGAYRIVLTEYKEQQKIASLFRAVEQKINLLIKKKEALESYKKGLMQKIFSQELRFKREDGTHYPEWDCQPLGDLAYITSGKSNREDSDTDAKYHFFDRSSDVRRSGIYLFDDDAVIVAGEGQEFIPKKYSGKFDLHQRAYAIMKFGNRLSYEYCYYFIFHHRRYFEKMAVGTTVLSLRLPMFQKMQIQLPSIDEQAKIASVFENLDSYLQKVSYSIQSTELLKRGLLQQMFV